MTYVSEWRATLGLSAKRAAELLGISETAFYQYESGRRRGTGKPVEIPRAIGLACTAIAFGLPPYNEGGADAGVSVLAAGLEDERLRQLKRALATGSPADRLGAARAYVAAADLGERSLARAHRREARKIRTAASAALPTPASVEPELGPAG